MDSEMAGLIRLRLGGMVEPQTGDQGQVCGPQVPLPGHGDEIENQYWVYREQLGTQTPASLGGMSHPLLPLS